MINTISFATTNEGKLKEAKEILDIAIEPLSLDVDEVQTLDPIVCAEKKAEYAYSKHRAPLLVEDTTLFFDAWNGLPGVFIDYFMKTLKNEGLLRLLKDEKNRQAKAQTTLCYFDGTTKHIVVGIIEGTISESPKGDSGFGWDPIFIPNKTNKTFAEMTSEEKNHTSMRKMAFEELKKKLDL